MFSASRNWFIVALAITNFGVALSSLYPTQPIADTVFNAGELAKVTWRDDEHEPHLKNIGLMKIDLHNNLQGKNNTYVATLARSVEPKTRSHTVFIPLNLPGDCLYNLRFISGELIIYTADFKISTTSNLFPADAELGNDDPNAIHPTSALGTYPNPTQQEPPSVTTIHAKPLPGSNNANGKTQNSQGIYFKLVSVLWPALIGISMAM